MNVVNSFSAEVFCAFIRSEKCREGKEEGDTTLRQLLAFLDLILVRIYIMNRYVYVYCVKKK